MKNVTKSEYLLFRDSSVDEKCGISLRKLCEMGSALWNFGNFGNFQELKGNIGNLLIEIYTNKILGYSIKL